MIVLGWFEKKLNPFPEETPTVPPARFFAFVWNSVKGARRYIVGIGITSVLLGVFEGILFYVLGRIVDWLSVVDPAQFWSSEGYKLFLLGAVILGSIVLVAVQDFLKFQVFATNFPMRLRWNFHRLMLHQSMRFFQDEFAGRITTKVMQTAQALRDIVIIIVDVLVFAAIYFVTMVLSAGSLEPFLLTPFLIWLVCYIVTLKWFVPRLAAASKKQADARSTMVGRITDAYTNIATVKLFAHAGREAQYAKFAMQEFLTAIRGLLRKITGFEIINHLLSMLLIISACGLTLWLWTKGTVGIGAMAAVGAMTLRLSGMSQWIMAESAQLFEQVGTIHDGMEMLSQTRSVTDSPEAYRLHVTAGDIRFENVTFSYGDPSNPPVMDHFSLHIRPGEKIGLVGRSGAGKSTLISLLLRFHDVGSGRILIDGQDISQVTQESLRSQIGMVMQDTSLLHRSVRDNILYGRPEATEEEVIAAIRRAEADHFIDALKDPKDRRGLDAHVGERGVKLSGGQRQRIAIARVMLKDAPILLLDEATSALDSEVEVAIQENLYRLMEGKTVVAIAHRLSTIVAMDRLIVMDQGRIIEEGDHHALLERDGVYARLWKHQSGGFLGIEE